MKIRRYLLLLAVPLLGASPALAADLTVFVDGIRNSDGRVYVTLY